MGAVPLGWVVPGARGEGTRREDARLGQPPLRRDDLRQPRQRLQIGFEQGADGGGARRRIAQGGDQDVVDAAREGARYGSLADPFIRQPIVNEDGTITCPNASTVFCIDANFFQQISDITESALDPITLDPTTDDVVISFFSVIGSGPTVIRYPNGTYYSRYGTHSSSFTTGDIVGRLTTNAPNTGVLVVEVYYNYHQVLKMPFFTDVIPDPIQVKTYAIMPLSAAEPTPTPIP